MKPFWLAVGFLGCAALVIAQSGRSYGPGRLWWEANQSGLLPWTEDYDNAEGMVGIVNQNGAVRVDGHPFFEALGKNGRACITCHQPSNAMSVSADAIRQRWRETDGKDAIFAAVDGSNCPGLPQASAASHSLLLDRGLFRIALPWPPKDVQPDFTLEVVHDPTGCNTSTQYGLKSAQPTVSVFRRPRMAGNLAFTTGDGTGAPKHILLMTDGREASLLDQALNAVKGHEEGAAPSREKLLEIVRFERQIFTAQSANIRAGLLTETGGPVMLGPQNLALGRAVSPVATGLISLTGWTDPPGPTIGDIQKEFRESVARGSALFAKQDCARCHSEKSAATPMEIGTVNRASRKDTGALPLFKVTCNSGQVIYSEDPGRALITGHCENTGAIVMQQLRGLAARAPYFSNGSAATLREVIEFYDKRFGIHYSTREKQDLENFLKVL
jgi:hypothetical protein